MSKGFMVKLPKDSPQPMLAAHQGALPPRHRVLWRIHSLSVSHVLTHHVAFPRAAGHL